MSYSTLRSVVAAWVILVVWGGSTAAAAQAPPETPMPVATPHEAGPSGGATAVTPLVPEPVRRLMQDREYTDAVEAIDEALKDEEAPQDYLLYLKARALHLGEKYDEAIAAFDRVAADHAEGDWARRARFGKAMSLARKGDFQAAQAIVQAEAEYLLSADRKQAIAEVYLEFADHHFNPPKNEQREPDYQKALDFYQRALDVGPKPATRAEVELLAARCLQQLDKLDEAVAAYERFTAEHADSPLDVEARYRLGECRLAQGALKPARRAWQDLLGKHVDAQHELIAEAALNLARTWSIPEPKSDEDLNLGTSAIEAFLERFPAHARAGEAYLDIARSFMHRGRYESAANTLERFLADDRYKDREEAAGARGLLGTAYQLQKKYAEAMAAWQDYLARHPAHGAWREVQQQMIDTEYLLGAEQYSEKEYDEARRLWSVFMEKYPLDDRCPKILYLFGQMHFNEQQWEEAVAAWRAVVAKYPGTDQSSIAQYRIGQTLEENLGRLDEALEEYKKVTWGHHQHAARQAATRLLAWSLRLATERIYRSDETPRLTLATRNLETVSIRAYKVDLETYFRKMHAARGVEGLDVALIDPDAVLEHPVPGYARYREIESRAEVPLPGEPAAGAMAVTVTGQTLEATTLVIQSDLDIVVKSSRGEVFVFAQNMLTGKPWPGVRLLLSDGERVIAEETTGPDGTFHGSYDVLKETDNPVVSVFAMAEGGHIASNLVDLAGVAVAQGLTDKGYLYTDRPAYRAGQWVHVRGCLRAVRDDRYMVDEGKAYTLEVFDARDRLVHRAEVTLGPWGSFHDRFLLPPAGPQGQYRVLVSDLDGRSYQGGFQVHEYRLEPVQLVIDAPRSVYYRGEEIEGVIRAAYYYGAPLAGREIRYQLADERLHTAVTDEKGEVAFKLPTREFGETQVLPLMVALPERNVTASRNFVLSAQGFSLSLHSVRPVYIAGETFEVAVTALDAEGKPIAEQLSLKVFEKTTVQGRVGERLVEEHAVETSEQDGAARQTLRLDRGGQYVVRAEGVDRFHNPISGEYAVQISDQEDATRLRILADRHSLTVGETAAVRLHWREAPALALVTFEGAGILAYRLVELAQGENVLELPVTADLAPNFDLAVAVMTDPRGDWSVFRPTEHDTEAKPQAENTDLSPSSPTRPPTRFHTASSPFGVERELKVSLSIGRKADVEEGEAGAGAGTLKRELQQPGDAADAGQVLRPGEEVEVTVTTADPMGNPVAAELSLAMVEQSLLDRFAWPDSIGGFFRGVPRTSGVNTTSSITFRYYPTTQPISPRLLAERDRLELAEEEAESLEATRLAMEAERPKSGAAGLAARAPDKPSAPDDPFAQPADEPTETADPFAAEDARQERLATKARELDQLKRTSDSREDGFWSQLDSVDQAAVPFDDRHPIVFPEDWHELIARRRQLERDRMHHPTDPPAEPIHETGYWNPAIVTGEDGRATVTFTVPDRSTAWQLMAKGITADTLAGEASESLTVKKDLFGQLKLPLGFTDGDKARIEAAVHNNVLPEGQIDVVLATTIGGRTVQQRKTLEVNAKGIEELTFDVDLTRPAAPDAENPEPAPEVDVLVELTVTAGEATDVLSATVPLRPFGAPVYATAAGSAAADTTAWVAPPEGMAFERPGLQILIGPSVEQSLLDIVLAPAPWCQAESARFTAGLESATSDLMAALGLMRLLAGTREAGGPQADALDTRVRSAIGLLVAAQNDDGGWSWTGRAGASDRFISARAVWALALARKAGFHVPDACHDKALTYLQTQGAAAAETDYESRAILLHALAVAGQGDFALANRLYRNRPALAPAALAYLALAFAEMDRKPVAQELADLLAQQDLDAPPARRPAGQGAPAWNHAPVELRALYALALEQVAPRSKAHEETVEWLMARRIGHRWSPDRATGPAALAVCAWYARSRFDGERYRLAIVVNDEEAAVLEVDPAAGTLAVDVPARLLKPEGQRIRFHLTGRGRYTYQCILGGFVPAEKLAGTTQDWRVERYYQPAPLEFDGRDVPRGFGGLQGSYSTFRNPLTQLPVGRRGMVELEVWRNNVDASTRAEQLEYLVVTEPIPSGTTVIERSVQGPFERFELTPEGITFYIGNRASIGTIRYELYGYLPGEYRASPTMVRNAHRPEQMAVSAPKSLKVLPAGEESADPYRLTPQELFTLGRLHYAKGDMPAAGRHLTELVDKWNLNADVYRQTVEMLLDVHLETGPAAQVVRWFEVVKERWPSVEIPFDKIVKVGDAYREMGEFERSYLVFRATVESGFMREARVPGFLQSQGEFARSVEVMARLLREYPPEGYMAAANYALAQSVYAKAPEAAGDPALRKAGLNRVELTRRAWSMLEAFLTEYPDDPAADQAAFAAASTLLDLERFDDAADACARYAERYPASELLDSFWYMIGYCRFATGEHEAALEMCRKVAEARRTDPRTGREEEARNKWRAIFILGQVHHSLGEAAKAIDEYRRVEDRFPDARQSIEYFTRKAIEMPEVTTISPEHIHRVLNVSAPFEVTARAMGQDYPGIELKFRNIAACDVKVYRIDLMKFTLLRRDLEGIARINLSGIRPYYEATIELGDGKDYRDRTHMLHWGSIAQRRMEEGAYLVVCRGDDLYTSGLVLVTPLAVEVQEDAASGRVRTTVKHSGEDRYLRGVHVKVIGSANDDFVAGQTDLRGVFVADGILGTSTVIAQADGPRYAFFRGRTPLALDSVRRATFAEGAPDTQEAPAPPQPSAELLEGLRDENIRFQHEQVEQLQELYESVTEGVEASVAF